MTLFRRGIRTALLALALLAAQGLGPAAAQDGTADAALTATIAALDKKLFDAYNACDIPAFTALFSPSVEFYHDKGGATFDRETVVANTQKYICGKVRRELLPATLKIYPIKDFGAIEEGEHRFCELASGQCEGSARFLMIWKQEAQGWQLTRVVSFGHRALSEKEKSELQPAKAAAAH